jgi:hypothetical protein
MTYLAPSRHAANPKAGRYPRGIRNPDVLKQTLSPDLIGFRRI